MDATERWPDALLDQQRQHADPLADEVVAQIVAQQGPEESLRLFDTLIRHLETPVEALPPVVNDFIRATRQLPAWTDWEKVATAHKLFLDHGPKFLIVLYYKSLPLLYSDAKGAEVLVRTSRLTHEDRSLKIFARRIAETGQFLIDVMTRGGLRDGLGIRSIQKVRLIHASIRHFLDLEGWDDAQLGRPINQEDMAATLMTFSVALIDALEQFDIEERPERLEAFFHTWTAIGHNMGVRNELLPASLDEGRQLLARILERQSQSSEAGQLLTKALADFGRETLHSDKLQAAPEAFIRFFIGEERARLLGVAPTYGCLASLAPELLGSFFRLGERLEDNIEGPVSLALDLISRKTALAMVDHFNKFKGRKFHIPEEMGKAWFHA
jgi:hypothetical protein